jgi:DNA sulfur modification protein DndD
LIFSKLSLLNFGPYRSNQEYDLAPRVKYGSPRPIILFGGKNGAGKTTLLEAINLCLYGPSSLGTAVTKREYEQYLLEKMHKDGSSQALNNTAVSLEFQYAHGGIQDEYYVSRSWKRRGARIKEQLVIKKNEEQLRDLNLDQWNSFLRELIPPGIAQLFFFDGEKIRRISGDRQVDHFFRWRKNKENIRR